MKNAERILLLCQCIRDKAEDISLGCFDAERVDIIEMADEIEELVK